MYFILRIAAYCVLYIFTHHSFAGLLTSYLAIGITGILLGFNVSHDACHDAFSKNKTVNHWLYHLSFNLQGTNAFLWQIRHNSSHHVFPNVDGCDADIDNNPFIRLSPQHELKKHHRFQQYYSILVYCMYTLHWLLVKDVLYLFRKRVANIRNDGYPLSQVLLFVGWKLLYVTVLITVPLLLEYQIGDVLLCFLVMHVINSLIFIHTLIATHLSMETQFPKADAGGFLPNDYYAHQLSTCLDYAPTSKLCNFFLGGFNAHAAHTGS